MNKSIKDPNQDVESWKDAYYEDFKKAPKDGLAKYLEDDADCILERNKIKFASTKTIKKSELVSA